MERNEILLLAEQIVGGASVEPEKLQALLKVPDNNILSLLSGADMIRSFHFGDEIHLCVICDARSDACSESRAFCSQSIKSEAPAYPPLAKEELKRGGELAGDTPINRYSIVTSGERLTREEVVKVAESMSELDPNKIATCVSLGILETEEFEILKKAGVGRYHHNLETARSHFDNICGAHSYDERVQTVKRAQAAGMSICSGGVFGLGESDEQIAELAFELKELDVDAVPLNFLSPAKGTPFENHDFLTPMKCLKIIAFFRYVLPDKDILIRGGREESLKRLSSLMFYAGASGVMTGDYLTTKGQSLRKDLEMIEQMGMKTRLKQPAPRPFKETLKKR